jgi:hypothetical protein
MSKVRTFSRTFPAKHVRVGLPTYFVEKILINAGVDYQSEGYLELLLELNEKNIKLGKLTEKDISEFQSSLVYKSIIPPDERYKRHTCRAGFHFKVGDELSPRVWSKKPYSSPQIIFYHDLTICKTYILELDAEERQKPVIEGRLRSSLAVKLANNDGLSLVDFQEWFKGKNFEGQIICWSHPEY